MVQYEKMISGVYRVYGDGFNEVHAVTEDEIIVFVEDLNNRVNSANGQVTINAPQPLEYEILPDNKYRIFGGGYNYTKLGSEADAQTELENQNLLMLNAAKDYALQGIRNTCDVIYSEQLVRFNVASKDSFLDQRKEALAWVSDNTTSTPFIDGLASGRGITREALLEKIIKNINLQTYLIGRTQYYEQILKDSADLGALNSARLSETLKMDVEAFVVAGGL